MNPELTATFTIIDSTKQKKLSPILFGVYCTIFVSFFMILQLPHVIHGHVILKTVASDIGIRVSTKRNDKGNLYFMSMAVAPLFSGRGIGSALLSVIEEEAKTKGCHAIVLEPYAPLKDAIRLYEKSGYRPPGMKRDYWGIEIFEMKKEI